MDRWCRRNRGGRDQVSGRRHEAEAGGNGAVGGDRAGGVGGAAEVTAATGDRVDLVAAIGVTVNWWSRPR